MGVKQVIVVRRDLRLRRAELASMVAKAASRFFLNADESDDPSKIEINLSKLESDWVSGGDPKFIVLGANSRTSLERLLFKADVEGIPAHTVDSPRGSEDGEGGDVAILALGPDDDEVIDRITGKLKLL